MRELNLQCGERIEQTAVDNPHGRHHKRELPAEHPPKVVRVHLRPGDHPRQRMNEHIEPEVGACLPERTQRLGVERLPLKLGRDDDARKPELDRASLELGCGLRGIEGWYVRKPDKTSW